MARDDSQKTQQDMATLTAMMVLGLIAAALLFLMAMVLPNLIAVVGLIAGIGLLIGFHYVVWGRWLKFPDENETPEPQPSSPESQRIP